MREFLLLPLIVSVCLIGAVIVLIGALILLPIAVSMERVRALRLGGIHQDRYLEDLDHDPFPPGDLERLRRLNRLESED